MLRWSWRCAVIVVGVLFVLPAHADEVALVVRINGAPTVERAGKTQPVHRGDSVNSGDTITTDAASKVKILLADDSVLAIGPSSRVTLTDFQLRPESRTVPSGSSARSSGICRARPSYVNDPVSRCTTVVRVRQRRRADPRVTGPVIVS